MRTLHGVVHALPMTDILSVSEVAELARVTQQAVVLACSKAQLPAEKKSGVWLIERSAAIAWIEARAELLRARADEATAAARDARKSKAKSSR